MSKKVTRSLVTGDCNPCNGDSPTCKKKKTESTVTQSTSPESSRSSERNIKLKKVETDEDNPKQCHRSCPSAGCDTPIPVCFVNADRCVGNGYTSRWYHMTGGEHFCNECFEYFYRSQKAGHKRFCDWKKRWISNGKTDPTIKPFMSDEILPFWVQCTNSTCGKWRQLPQDANFTKDLIAKYECSMNADSCKKNFDYCAVPEDERVAKVKDASWMTLLTVPSYLKNSPAAKFLGAYFPEGVGISPLCEECINANKAYQEIRKRRLKCSEGSTLENEESNEIYQQIPGLNPIFHPFYQPDEHGKALCVRPDVMEPDEIEEFPGFAKDPTMYLAIRNLILAIWSLNYTKWLVLSDVAEHLICRGLIRIRYILEADQILNFLTRKAAINLGLLTVPQDWSLIPPEKKENIIVIGAGASGLSTARQLNNFGFQVTVIEGRDRLGGRVWDDTSMGTCIGKGAQIVTGVINNPLTLICEQAALPLRYIGDKCDLYNIRGEIVDFEIDHKMDVHFNAILDEVANWRKEQDDDISLLDKLMEVSRLSCVESGEDLSKDEFALLDFHISNLEYACGSVLSNVSALNWDQNEAFSQFAGDHTLLPNGYNLLLSKISDGLDVRLNTRVYGIDYSGREVRICTETDTFTASKVVVTVPLALLQRDIIDFKPPLPVKKQKAINSLGSGIIEKIALLFPHRFWDSKLMGADFFGYIPVSSSERGLFSIFYDMTPHNKTKESGPHILMTYVSGDAVNVVEQQPPAEVVGYCMKILRKIFSESKIVVPDPIRYFVTNWRNDPFSFMAYSYVKVGGSGDAYDDLGEDIEKKVFFAGEATNRQFPQTVTGAFISGLREANKIAKVVLESA